MNKLSVFTSKTPLKIKSEDLTIGSTIKVRQKIKEGEKSRIQSFEGILIAKKHGNEAGGTITIRRVSDGFGVEKIFPIRLPSIEKIEVVKKARARKSKLYYLRNKSAKEIRRKLKQA